MSDMRITFLGTSASAPTKERGLPAVFLEYRGKGILFDVGEGTQRQFMRFGASVMRVEHVFISHYHGDHVFGLPGLLATLGLYGRDRSLHVWAPARQITYIEAFLKAIPLGVEFPVELHPVEAGTLLKTPDFTLSAYPLDHTADCFAYVFQEPPRIKARKDVVRTLGIEGPLVGELKRGHPIEWQGRIIRPEDVVYVQEGRKIVYAVDTRPVFNELAQGADILIHDSTFLTSDADLAVAKKHSTAREAAELARALNVGKLYLFHFSARIKDVTAAENEAREVFPHSFAARDGERVYI